MEQIINIKVQGKPFTFTMTAQAYNRFIDETLPGNRVSPAHNLLVRTVDPEQKEALQEVLALPSAAIQLVEALTIRFVPDLKIEVGE